jgi:hypothetical protein
VDFSAAQRKGFIAAFVTTMQGLGDTRPEGALKTSAAALLKGCHYHFQESANRVSKIGSYVPLLGRQLFLRRVKDLKMAQSTKEFSNIFEDIISQWPSLKDWIDWWNQEGNKQMIFRAYRKMDEKLWEALPDTTNAEESMHYKIYQAIGKGHGIIEGLQSLVKLVNYLDEISRAAEGRLLSEF